MLIEFYIDDPNRESKMRVMNDDSGLWYIFRADGAEYVYDTLEDLLEDYGKLLLRHAMTEAGIA